VGGGNSREKIVENQMSWDTGANQTGYMSKGEGIYSWGKRAVQPKGKTGRKKTKNFTRKEGGSKNVQTKTVNLSEIQLQANGRPGKRKPRRGTERTN